MNCPRCEIEHGQAACAHCGQVAVEFVRVPRIHPWPWVALVLTGLSLAILVIPNFIRARAQPRMNGCESNLKNIGLACEMYSTDWQGRYPPNLGLLTPKYLKTIPTCQQAGRDTYSDNYHSASVPDNYTFYCQGLHHAYIGVPNYPRYTAVQGFVEYP